MRPEQMAGLGIAHVPQGRGTFPELTVEENLQVGAYVRKDRADDPQRHRALVRAVPPPGRAARAGRPGA